MITRRALLRASGGAVLAVCAAPYGARAFAATDDAARLGAWLRIGADGVVDVFTGKVEIGMGTLTGLAQTVAEELDVPLERIRLTAGDTDLTPDQGGVGGSTSTQLGARPLRNAAAEARRILVAAAAARFGVAPEQLVTEHGIVRDANDATRTVAYGDLVTALANDPALRTSGESTTLDVHGTATPKEPRAYRLVGAPVARLDVAPKAYGRFRYVVDVRVPGMLHARVVRPPSVGARPLAVDDAPLRELGDARLVRIGDLLAVVATREWDAVRGADALVVRWSAPSTQFPAMGTLADAMWAMPAASRDTPVVRGAPDDAFAGAQVVEAAYAWPFQAHATMGPGCAVGDVRPGGRATIWCGAQKPHALRAGIADLLGLAPARVRVIFVEDAGSYGRGGFDDAAADAALLSRALGKPVRVQWMRHDMTQWGPKAPAIVARARGALRDGTVAALDLTLRAFNGGEISSHPDNAGNFLAGQIIGRPNIPRTEYAAYGKNSPAYAIPALRAVAELVAPLAPAISPLRTTHMRDPEGPGTTFVVESFVDELAHAAGADPLAFRLRHLTDPRHLAVLHAVATASDWNRPIDAAARGRGVAFATRGESRGATVVATVAEVVVDTATGAVRVVRLTCAHDCGLIVNPRSLRGTVEANLMQSLSRALFEEVRFDAGTVTSRDWETYPVLRAPDVPDRVDVVLLDHPDAPPQGAGEPASRPTAAAVANAIFAATGARVRTAPLHPRHVLAALAQASAARPG